MKTPRVKGEGRRENLLRAAGERSQLTEEAARGEQRRRYNRHDPPPVAALHRNDSADDRRHLYENALLQTGDSRRYGTSDVFPMKGTTRIGSRQRGGPDSLDPTC
jgi:hypothetical protein